MIGRTISHYRITGKLGEGGMGVVYRAEDVDLGRTVALKFLSPELTRDPAAKERFRVEAQAASRLDHPNICTVYEIGETDDARLFISMACYDGDTLARRVAEGPLPPAEAVGIAADVASGLAAAHAKHMVHRDIKPGNVLVTGAGRAKILDFGLAKLGAPSDLTRDGARLGTVAYMSPEQARGQEADSRSDLWSLGVVLYELLTGRRPFGGESGEATLYAICNAPVPPPSELVPGLPHELDEVVARCLEKTPSKRYRSANELRDALKHVAELLPERRDRTELDTTPLPVALPHSRRRLAAWLAAGAAVIAVAAFLWLHPMGRSLLVGGDAPLPKPVVLAVLPFDGTDPEYARGFSDYVTGQMQEMEQFTADLRVIPAPDVRAFGVTEPAQAGPVLGADAVLTGRLDSSGDSLRVRLSIVDADDGEELRSWETIEQPANVAALQDVPVRFVGSALEIELPGRALHRCSATGTTVPMAFDAYVRGTAILNAAASGDTASISRAISLLRAATRADPAFALAHAELGRATWVQCAMTRDFACGALAEQSLLHALDLEERCTPARVTLAVILRHAGYYDEAASELRTALAEDPMSVAARRELAALREENGQTALAETAYREAVELRARYRGARDDLGVFLASQGRFDEAVDEFTAVTEIAPGNALGYRNLGVMYYSLDRWDEAAEMFETSLELSPDYSTYSNLATLHFARARYADAAAMYEEALRIDDTDYRVWGNLGASYLWIPGEADRADAAYREAAARGERQRELTPRDAQLLTLLAGYYAQLDQPERARGLLDAALAQAPGDVEVIFQVGHTHEVLGDREEALSWIERALEHGYSRAQVENTPALRGLCADERYLEFAERTADREFGL